MCHLQSGLRTWLNTYSKPCLQTSASGRMVTIRRLGSKCKCVLLDSVGCRRVELKCSPKYLPVHYRLLLQCMQNDDWWPFTVTGHWNLLCHRAGTKLTLKHRTPYIIHIENTDKNIWPQNRQSIKKIQNKGYLEERRIFMKPWGRAGEQSFSEEHRTEKCVCVCLCGTKCTCVSFLWVDLHISLRTTSVIYVNHWHI